MGELGQREWRISGRCGSCQDAAFVGKTCGRCERDVPFSQLGEPPACPCCRGPLTESAPRCLRCGVALGSPADTGRCRRGRRHVV